MKKFSEALDQIHLTGNPRVDLVMDGDARDAHSFQLQVVATAPERANTVVAAHDLKLKADLTAPAGAPTNFNSAWDFGRTCNRIKSDGRHTPSGCGPTG